MKKELTIKNYDLGQVKQMTEMSNVLKNHIVKQKLFTPIAGKNYVQVEGWQFAGGLMGLYPRIVKVENLSTDKIVKWQAEVEIVRLADNQVISRGFAVCSSAEGKKKSFDEYAILSMAQTRAIGKAFRNIVGWVMKLAGYEATPKEEVVAKVEETQVEEKETDINQTMQECHNCGELITDEVAEFSKKMFKKQLCRNCQKELKKK